jgi:hypothetical protein
MFDIGEMWKRLSRYHWSPLQPSAYVLVNDAGSTAGVGLVAHKAPGAFNLAWAASQGQWKTIEEQQRLCANFLLYSKIEGIIINERDKLTIGELTCLSTPTEFLSYMSKPELRHLQTDLQVTLNSVRRLELTYGNH